MATEEIDDDTLDDRSEIEALFDVADGDGDGRVDFEEFCRLIADLDPDPAMDSDALRIGFAEIDTDHDRRIDRAEFLAWWLED
jgi:Ca2+-binding EF-hand superfamily protein